MKKRILVVGGYGAVGTDVCRTLASDSRVELIVGGRSAERGRVLAEQLGATSRVIDAFTPGSALENVDVVINCFIDLKSPTLGLANACIDRGLFYLDVAGIPLSHCEAILALDEQARTHRATLITALGCNPGIPALLALTNRGLFEKIDSVDFYFALGSKLTGLSILSMQGVGQLMEVPAKFWREGDWRDPDTNSVKRMVAEPFNREVYYGPAMITADLRNIPTLIDCDRLAFWSGIEDALQGLLFIAGVKLGGTTKPNRAERLLRLLKVVAGKTSHEEAVLEMMVNGVRQSKKASRHIVMSCTEEYFTAIAPALVVQQWLDGEFEKYGAFVAPDIVPAVSFVSRLGRMQTQFRETWGD